MQPRPPKKVRYQFVPNLEHEVTQGIANVTVAAPVATSSTSTSTTVSMNKLCQAEDLFADIIAHILSYFANDLPRLRELRLVSKKWLEIIDESFKKIGSYNYGQIKQDLEMEYRGSDKGVYESIGLSADGQIFACIQVEKKRINDIKPSIALDKTKVNLIHTFVIESTYQPYAPKHWTTLNNSKQGIIMMCLLEKILFFRADRHPIRGETNQHRQQIAEPANTTNENSNDIANAFTPLNEIVYYRRPRLP